MKRTKSRSSIHRESYLGCVGLFLSGFGLTYGKALSDPIISVLLFLFGFLFMCIAVPAVMEQADNIQTKVHFAVVCLSMAFWCLAVARLSSNADVTIVVISIIGYGLELIKMAIFQRLFFGSIFSGLQPLQ